MKVTKLIKIGLFGVIIGLGAIQTVHADHATNFLDALQANVAERLENSDTNSAAEKRALAAANKILNRNSSTLNGDLGQLAQAATALSRQFPEDLAFSTEEEVAVTAYSAEAQARLNAVGDIAGTNALPRSVTNLLNQAQTALDRANDTDNTIPVRARAVAFALNKIRVADLQAHRFFKAPLSLDDTVTLNGRNNSGTVTLDGTHAYTITGDPTDELGTWSYERTSATTATITLNPTTGEDQRTIDLKFTNSTHGTFTGTTASGDPFRGTFTISDDI
jgi:hypothetical protein